jgi:hypothetical protein
MPGFNGTGPQSAGSMTGWGRGYCMAYLNQDSRPERRPGMGGRGWRNCLHVSGLPRQARWAPGRTLTGAVYASPLNSESGLDDLREQVGYLEKALEEIKRRIQELEKQE